MTPTHPIKILRDVPVVIAHNFQKKKKNNCKYSYLVNKLNTKVISIKLFSLYPKCMVNHFFATLTNDIKSHV